ncbi:hypothetical protein HMN09_00872000 [Mycena chlorophos]|uniref:Presequence translocated-associated motor subunit PAM17 n=1 Tax=Mycena chlorophos TaxID=658473 RepID=A0A8H6SMK9_MYCCL|nr:hypothetical protein HMN09_00872000 [Mycena chlorophos]
MGPFTTLNSCPYFDLYPKEPSSVPLRAYSVVDDRLIFRCVGWRRAARCHDESTLALDRHAKIRVGSAAATTQRRPRSALDTIQLYYDGQRAAVLVTWSEYFAQRKRRRHFQTAATIPTAAIGFLAGSAYFGSLQADATKPGIDPLLLYGGCVILCGGAGWVVGPSVGGSIWRVFHRQSVAQIDALDREFFKHVARNRVDATLQSATNPIPDYYGEN